MNDSLKEPRFQEPKIQINLKLQKSKITNASSRRIRFSFFNFNIIWFLELGS
jgi:hypothetical protein